MLTVQSDRLEDAPLLIAGGRLDGTGAAAFDAASAPLRSRPGGPVAVDMGGVDYLSSAGLRSLMLLAKACWKSRAKVLLFALQPPVRQVFEMAGLLDQFEIVAGRAEAAQRLRERSAALGRSATASAGGREHTVVPLPGGASVLELRAAGPAGRLACLGLDELGVAFGRAGLGNTAARAAEAAGPFVSTGRMVSVRPAEPADAEPDFIVASNPADVPVYVADYRRLAGAPAAFVSAADGVSTVAAMIDAFDALLRQTAGREAGTCGWIVAALEPAGAPDDGWVGVGCREADGSWRMEAVCASPLALHADPADPGAYLAAALRVETLSGAFAPAPDRAVGRYIAWLYAPAESRAAVRGLDLAFEDEPEAPEEWDWIARRVYEGAGRVRLRRLSGGFSAATFQAESFDREGRRMLPTVLKLADRAFSEREDRAYDLYVSKYILNNSAVRMGRCARNEWVGLRYNFLGITGPESRLQWIGRRLVDRPVEDTLPLFRELFGRILAPWYGQARPASVAPYREHDPRRLFPGLVAGARDALGIGPEQPFIPCPPLGRDLPNPYALLERVYPARAAAEWPGMSSVVHGDLNLNNVLLDERDNLFVIDFSETHVGDLGGDFSRIEPLLLLQMTRLRDEADLAALLRHVQALACPDRLFDPPAECPGDDPFLPKAHAVVRLLRSEYRRLAGGRAHAVPYLLGLLRWTLPIVVFRQMPQFGRLASCYAAGVLAEALLEADPEAARCLSA